MAGDGLQYRWDRFMTRVLSLLQPLLIALVGGFVLLVVLSIILPLLSLTQSLR